MTAKTIGLGTTLTAGYTITTADGNGFALTNNGVLGSESAAYSVLVQTTGDFVDNAGKIFANTATGKGVFSGAPVRVTNRSGGTISAAYGISLNGGGTIFNASGALITGLNPIRASNTSVSVNNYGVIAGTGSGSTQAGVLLNSGGYVYNRPDASISGANGASMGVSGKVRNAGTIKGNSADGVDLTAGGTVTTESQFGHSAATISGGYAGIVISGGSGYVLNGSGQISGGTGGVFLQAGGYLHQIGGTGGGTINANYAVAINNGTGTVDTGGVIIGGALGVGMDGAGPHKVTLSGIQATISGAKAISISGGNGYVYTKGTINGTGINGTAVTMAAGYTNLLEVYSGAKITGKVDGGNYLGGLHQSSLLLAQGFFLGTLTGFGSRYINFETITVAPSADWTMDSSDTFVTPTIEPKSGSLDAP
jgi:hypothetical protein